MSQGEGEGLYPSKGVGYNCPSICQNYQFRFVQFTIIKLYLKEKKMTKSVCVCVYNIYIKQKVYVHICKLDTKESRISCEG